MYGCYYNTAKYKGTLKPKANFYHEHDCEWLDSQRAFQRLKMRLTTFSGNVLYFMLQHSGAL